MAIGLQGSEGAAGAGSLLSTWTIVTGAGGRGAVNRAGRGREAVSAGSCEGSGGAPVISAGEASAAVGSGVAAVGTGRAGGAPGRLMGRRVPAASATRPGSATPVVSADHIGSAARIGSGASDSEDRSPVTTPRPLRFIRPSCRVP